MEILQVMLLWNISYTIMPILSSCNCSGGCIRNKQLRNRLGDLLVWAHKGNYFDFDKISVSETDTIELRLHQGVENNTVFRYDMMAPF